MGADSFGARADPTTEQLKWKKVQCYAHSMCFYNEPAQDWRLEGVIWFLSNILDLHGIFCTVAELGTDFDIDPRCGLIWAASMEF